MEKGFWRQYKYWLVFVASFTWSISITRAQVATIADLVSVTLPASTSGQQVIVAGRDTAGDGGGGVFVYDSASAVATNTYSIFAPASLPGRWIRLDRAFISSLWSGTSPEQLSFTGTSTGTDYSWPFQLRSFDNRIGFAWSDAGSSWINSERLLVFAAPGDNSLDTMVSGTHVFTTSKGGPLYSRQHTLELASMDGLVYDALGATGTELYPVFSFPNRSSPPAPTLWGNAIVNGSLVVGTTPVIGSPRYHPTGANALNDLTTSGTYTGSTNLHAKVLIVATGTPDSFGFSMDNGATYAYTNTISGAAQVLTNGVTITFAATTGHTLGDFWKIYATPGGSTSSNLTVKGTSTLQGATTVPTLKAGPESLTYTSLVGARGTKNNFEFGHPAAGYGSTLGGESSSGYPFIAFNAGAGTTADTYKTVGQYGTVIRNEAGSLVVYRVTNNNADNQTPSATFKFGQNSVVSIYNVSVFANNAAALAGGLVAGDVYRTGGDPDVLCIVH